MNTKTAKEEKPFAPYWGFVHQLETSSIGVLDAIENLINNETIPRKLELPQFRMDFDREADVLYIHIGEVQEATDTKDIDGVLLRFKDEELIGVTFVDYLKRLSEIM